MEWDKIEGMRYDYSNVVVKYIQHTCFPLKNSFWHFIVILRFQTAIRQKLLQKQWTVIKQEIYILYWNIKHTCIVYVRENDWISVPPVDGSLFADDAGRRRDSQLH